MERELKLGWEEGRKLSFLFLVDCTHTLRQTSRLDEQRERVTAYIITGLLSSSGAAK